MLYAFPKTLLKFSQALLIWSQEEVTDIYKMLRNNWYFPTLYMDQYAVHNLFGNYALGEVVIAFPSLIIFYSMFILPF